LNIILSDDSCRKQIKKSVTIAQQTCTLYHTACRIANS